MGKGVVNESVGWTWNMCDSRRLWMCLGKPIQKDFRNCSSIIFWCCSSHPPICKKPCWYFRKFDRSWINLCVLSEMKESRSRWVYLFSVLAWLYSFFIWATKSCQFLEWYSMSRYGFLWEIWVKIREWVVRDISKNRISNSEQERGWLRKPMHWSGKGPKVPHVGRASVYLVRAVTKWITCL